MPKALRVNGVPDLKPDASPGTSRWMAPCLQWPAPIAARFTAMSRAVEDDVRDHWRSRPAPVGQDLVATVAVTAAGVSACRKRRTDATYSAGAVVMPS